MYTLIPPYIYIYMPLSAPQIICTHTHIQFRENVNKIKNVYSDFA